MKFEEKIRKFMYGRYGPDELYKFLCICNNFTSLNILQRIIISTVFFII